MDKTRVLGDFALKVTSMTFRPGPGASVLIECNCEGTASGFGLTCGTMTVCGAGQKSGTWSWCACAYPEDGNNVTGSGTGGFLHTGGDCWRMTGFLTVSDGRSCLVEGDFLLGQRSWTGQLLERC